MATSLDVLSDGRVEFGLGSGSVEKEHLGTGLPWGSFPERSERLAESLEIVTEMFAGEQTSFAGATMRSRCPERAAPGPAAPPADSCRRHRNSSDAAARGPIRRRVERAHVRVGAMGGERARARGGVREDRAGSGRYSPFPRGCSRSGGGRPVAAHRQGRRNVVTGPRRGASTMAATSARRR